ncbi:hypothetical protein DAPPUDRAFT_245388 [Daphnia pulex]|uniref:Uncharacterized protein n=1 Tax=Daphnia pulex TaxID=6669 RepID=E9GN91_DAPPU|nr:hypothetical protein DAPPUDRAFT_245388 [Daphnia pulex]|eukprot:EFX78994.1 hypothetical protein DAPPUDRAFT_245388 [Daphnia pulex]
MLQERNASSRAKHNIVYYSAEQQQTARHFNASRPRNAMASRLICDTAVHINTLQKASAAAFPFLGRWNIPHAMNPEPCPSQNRKVMTSGLIGRRLYGPNNSSSDTRYTQTSRGGIYGDQVGPEDPFSTTPVFKFFQFFFPSKQLCGSYTEFNSAPSLEARESWNSTEYMATDFRLSGLAVGPRSGKILPPRPLSQNYPLDLHFDDETLSSPSTTVQMHATHTQIWPSNVWLPPDLHSSSSSSGLSFSSSPASFLMLPKIYGRQTFVLNRVDIGEPRGSWPKNRLSHLRATQQQQQGTDSILRHHKQNLLESNKSPTSLMNQFNAASGTWNQFFFFSVRSFLLFLDNATNNKNVDCRHILQTGSSSSRSSSQKVSSAEDSEEKREEEKVLHQQPDDNEGQVNQRHNCATSGLVLGRSFGKKARASKVRHVTESKQENEADEILNRLVNLRLDYNGGPSYMFDVHPSPPESCNGAAAIAAVVSACLLPYNRSPLLFLWDMKLQRARLSDDTDMPVIIHKMCICPICFHHTIGLKRQSALKNERATPSLCIAVDKSAPSIALHSEMKGGDTLGCTHRKEKRSALARKVSSERDHPVGCDDDDAVSRVNPDRPTGGGGQLHHVPATAAAAAAQKKMEEEEDGRPERPGLEPRNTHTRKEEEEEVGGVCKKQKLSSTNPILYYLCLSPCGQDPSHTAAAVNSSTRRFLSVEVEMNKCSFA